MTGPAQEAAGATAAVPELGIAGRPGALTASRPACLRRLRRDPSARATLGGRVHHHRDRPVRRVHPAVRDLSGGLGRGEHRTHVLGHAARQPAAARLVDVGRVLLYDRAARVHADRCDRRPEPGRTHIAAAITYTLVLVLSPAGQEPRDVPRRRGEGAISGGIMLAPQLGVGVFVLLLSVGHIGTAVPVLAVWLILDRAPRRWYVPVVAACLLGWVMVADSLILVVAIAPLALVGVARALWWLAGRARYPGEARYPREARYRAAAAVRVVRAVAGRGGDHRGRHLVAAAAGSPRRRWLHRAPDPVQPGPPGQAWGARRDHRGQPAGAVRRQLRRPALRSRRRVRRAPPRGSRAGGLGAGPDTRAGSPAAGWSTRCSPSPSLSAW